MLRHPVLGSLALLALSVFGSGPAGASGGGDTPVHPSSDRVPDGLTSSEWSSIRAAYEAGRHVVVEVAGGHRARNPGQQWLTTFDGRGFTTRPDEGGWTWGLELVSYGFESRERAVSGRACASAEGGRLRYEWDGSLTEWYVNDTRGLEHGYTLRNRPEGEGSLVFTLAVRGDLAATVQTDGCGVSFAKPEGGSALTYAGLEVFDADGRALPTGIEVSPEGLRLLIDERGARYPLTIDPIAQQAYLKASNTGVGDWFGSAVAVSGDTVVVGADGEDSNATGVNGNQADNSATASGAAYVFVRSGTTWSQQAYLKASNTGAGDRFGGEVAVSGDTVVVGAHMESSNATGVNGDQADNSAVRSGAAYVFVRAGTTWSQQAYLKASNTGTDDRFGNSVTIFNDTAVIGANEEDSSATGVNGNELDDTASNSGAAYVFVRSGTTWTQQAYLKASNTGASDIFGMSVSMSGDTVVVGAVWEDSNATGVNGNELDDTASNSGAAYVFVRSATTWTQQAYLKASNTGASDQFGWSVSMSGDTVVIAAAGEDSSATGVNGNELDDTASNSGAAYVFVRSGTTWTQQAYLKASNTGASDAFRNVSLSGDTVVVGAEGEDSNATGVDGDQSNNSAAASGAAYVFVRTGGVWSQLAYVKASNTGSDDQFGWSVSMSGDTVVVGATGENSNATGIDGDQSNNSMGDSGAAYIFQIPPGPAVTVYCFGDGSGTACPCGNAGAAGNGCASSVNPAGGNLAASGVASLGADTLGLAGSGMPNNSALYFQGTTRANGGLGNVFGDGLRCAGGSVLRLGTKVNAAGASQYPAAGDPPVSVRGAITAPGTRTYQVWYRNAASFCTTDTFNLTNGVEVGWVL